MKIKGLTGIIITGAQASGKSTLLRQLEAHAEGYIKCVDDVVKLEDIDNLLIEAAKSDGCVVMATQLSYEDVAPVYRYNEKVRVIKVEQDVFRSVYRILY